MGLWPPSVSPSVRSTAPVRRTPLRDEYVTRGTSSAVSDHILVEIIDDVYLPLVRGRGVASDTTFLI